MTVDLKSIDLHAGWSSSTSESAVRAWGPLAPGLDLAMKVPVIVFCVHLHFAHFIYSFIFVLMQ